MSDFQQGYYREPTWRDRLRRRLFPAQLLSVPDKPIAEDVLHHDTRVWLDWKDRLRILCSGRIVVRVRTGMPTKVGAALWTVSDSTVVWRHEHEQVIES